MKRKDIRFVKRLVVPNLKMLQSYKFVVKVRFLPMIQQWVVVKRLT